MTRMMKVKPRGGGGNNRGSWYSPGMVVGAVWLTFTFWHPAGWIIALVLMVVIDAIIGVERVSQPKVKYEQRYYLPNQPRCICLDSPPPFMGPDPDCFYHGSRREEQM